MSQTDEVRTEELKAVPDIPTPRDSGDAARYIISEYELALASDNVTFEQLVDSCSLRAVGEPDIRKANDYYYPKLRDSFVNAQDRKGISRYVTAPNLGAAAMLTGDRSLYFTLGKAKTLDPELFEQWPRIARLAIRAREFLTKDEFKTCIEPLFVVIAYCLASLESELVVRKQVESEQKLRKAAEDPPADEKAKHAALVEQLAKFLQDAYVQAEGEFWQIVERTALVRYFVGMLLGSLVLTAIAGLSSMFHPDASLMSFLGLDRDLLVTSLIAGSLGATVSVLQRVTSGSFELNRATAVLQLSHRFMSWLLGALRPVLGAVFGLALYTFMTAKLLPIAPPDGVQVSVYVAALAFLSGFSERFAQDVIVQSLDSAKESKDPARSADKATEK